MIATYPPVYQCVRTTETMRVDGRLDEETWLLTPRVRLADASNGRTVAPLTTVRACWTESHLYLAFECEDDDIWGTLARHDDPLYDEEVVEVFLCPTGVLSRYYEIEISPRNVVFDAAIHSPDLHRRTMSTDLDWSWPGMETAVHADAPVHTTAPVERAVRGPGGTWTVELAIPFECLPPEARPVPGTEWRVNFYRIDRGARDVYQAWSPTLKKPADYHVPERFGFLRFEEENARDLLAGQWTPERATKWYAGLPWLVGCNFIPSTASNQLEMWQAETFDAATVDRELGWAASVGMNVGRVYLHDLAWTIDPAGFRDRVRQFLAIASAHGIRVVFVLFDDCWNPVPHAGPQEPPTPGVHNSRWLQSPGADVVNDATRWDRLEAYVKDVIGSFRNDRRILLWDLYNEPGNGGQGIRSLPLLRRAFQWAREVRPVQPLSAGVWMDDARLNGFQILHSDIVTFHCYGDADALRRQIDDLRRYGRPLLCTEWMARPTSTIPTHLPIFKENNVGCIQWGLVAGKTQTIYPWGSPPGAPEPQIWFHDLLKPDGSPYDPTEVQCIRQLTGRGR